MHDKCVGLEPQRLAAVLERLHAMSLLRDGKERKERGTRLWTICPHSLPSKAIEVKPSALQLVANRLAVTASPLPDNIRVMVIVWRLRGNIIRTAMCWIVWYNVHSPQHTYVSSSYRSNRLGLSHWDRYTLCIEAVAYIIVRSWSGSAGIQAWSRRPTGFLQCFDTVGLVIWPVKTVPEMTYYVSSETLNPTHSPRLAATPTSLD